MDYQIKQSQTKMKLPTSRLPIYSCKKPLSKPYKNAGFTLVELLVGLVLSLFIIGIALLYFVSSSQTFRVQTSDSIVQENARFALEILTQNLRLAGLNPSNDAALGLALGTGLGVVNSFCSATEGGLADGASSNVRCTVDNISGDVNASDRISVSYILEADEAPISVRGCNNAPINVSFGERVRLSNILWTAVNPTSGGRSLYCQSFNLDTQQALGVALPIVDGIESMQFLYGVDNLDADRNLSVDLNGDGLVDSDGVIDRFQNIGAVVNTSTIKAVRVALLVSSGLATDTDSNTEDADTRIYNLLGQAITLTDRKSRQIFSTTVLIPNSI